MNEEMKKARLERGISISELARNVQVTERYLRFIESGEKQPSLKTAQKIANALGGTVDKFF